jgi:hypothetical protein
MGNFKVNHNSADKEKNRRLCGNLATTSKVIGISWLVITILIFALLIFTASAMNNPFEPVFDFYGYAGVIVCVLGIISGLYGLLSEQKKPAITGIVICLLLLVLDSYVLHLMNNSVR